MTSIAHPSSRTLGRATGERPHALLGVGAIAGLAILARLPLIGLPVTPDEGGLLLLSGQWHPGTSLYGDYWVDRPPLLVDFFAVASHSGGLVALRIGGCLVVFVAVVLAGLIGSEVARSGGGDERATHRTALISAAAAAVFLANPLFSAYAVDGEVIAAPLILGAIWLVLRSIGQSDPRFRFGPFVAAGACAAGAVLLKQNEIDAVVFLAAFALLGRSHGLLGRRDIGALLLGGGGLTVLVLIQAAALGTYPAGLWDATVTFRFLAGDLIRSSASSATSTRMHHLLAALLISGVPLIIGAALVRSRGTPPRSGTTRTILGAALTMLIWETISVAAGGSYWLHYLLCFVPGLVLLVTVSFAHHSARDGNRSLVVPALTYAGVVSMLAILVVATHADRMDSDAGTAAWLREHASPSDTAVVLYGHPNILFAAGLTSPYPQLWSLPVRVRDSQLAEFSATLNGAHPPSYVVTPATGLTTWGINPIQAQRTLEHLYAPVENIDGHTIYGLRANLESSGVAH